MIHLVLFQLILSETNLPPLLKRTIFSLQIIQANKMSCRIKNCRLPPEVWNYTNAIINTKRNTILSKQRNPFEFYETNPSCRVQGKTVVTARGHAYLEPGREMASRAATPIPTDFFSQTDQQVSKDGALSSPNHFRTYNTISHDCTWGYHQRYFMTSWPLYCVQLSQAAHKNDDQRLSK